MIHAIDSIEHFVHACGLELAMVDRAATYKCDPEPRIHRTVPREPTGNEIAKGVADV